MGLLACGVCQVFIAVLAGKKTCKSSTGAAPGPIGPPGLCRKRQMSQQISASLRPLRKLPIAV